MKNLVYLLLLSWIPSTLFAQVYIPNPYDAGGDILAIEYFFNQDPGLGLGIDLTFTSSQNVTFVGTINTNTLSNGMHLLHVRTKDSNGKWSLIQTEIVFKGLDQYFGYQSPGADLVKLEYFIDTDPGLGLATNLTVIPGQDITYTSSINVSSLSSGIHFLHVRIKDADGKWSHLQTKLIFNDLSDYFDNKAPGPNITELEYFINEDPGLGLANSLSISPGQDVNYTGSINLSNLDPGTHFLHVRAKDADGKWSHFQTNILYVELEEYFGYNSPGMDIIYAEHFIDTDPGIGAAIEIPLTPGQDITAIAQACVNGLATGDHYLHLRVKDLSGKWSLIQTDTFQIQSGCVIYDPTYIQISCDDNNTADIYSDDTFDFSMIVIGVNIDNQYTITGDVTSVGSFSCDVPSFNNNNGIGYSTQAGDLTFTITDNLDSSCSKVWTVDVPLPDPLSCSNATIGLDVNGMVQLLPSMFHSGNTCGVDTITFTQSLFDCASIGTQTVTMTQVDVEGNEDNCSIQVIIEDNVPPITISQDITIALDEFGNATILPIDVDGGSTDNCSINSMSIDISSFDCNNMGANTVTLSCVDGSGNSSSDIGIVTIVDSTPPVINCMDITVQLDAVGMSSISAGDISGLLSDNCGISDSSVNISSFDCNDEGSNIVILTVTDLHGNASSCTAQVNVEDPMMACCQISLTVNLDPIPDDTYSAINELISSKTVPVNGLVIFHAGTQICLDPGFEVASNAVFEAYIDPCENN